MSPIRLICLSVLLAACSDRAAETPPIDAAEMDSVVTSDATSDDAVDTGPRVQDVVETDSVLTPDDAVDTGPIAQDVLGLEDVLVSEDTAKDDISDVELEVEKCIDQQFADRLAQLVAKTCSLCHTNEGQAAASGLNFASLHSGLGSVRDATNREQLLAYLSASAEPEWIYKKPTAVIPHGGGSVLIEGSLEAAALQDFVESVVGEGGCAAVAEPVVDPAVFELASPKHTLWLAARLLTDREPTAAELAQVGDDISSIDSALEAVFETKAFEERIAQFYEDVLHTNMFNGKNDSSYIQRAWGMVTDTEGNTRGDHRWMDAYDTPQGVEWKALLVNSVYGFSRSARELVAYVVREEKDFGEILTADYTMMNAYSVRTYGAELLLPETAPFEPAEVSTVDRTAFVPVVLEEVPTAGLLTDINFLAVNPTTPVNLNRNRSREVNEHFLATDILHLSNRAILDFGSPEVNPTYNKSACLVCHKVMDPVSGAYQNWPRNGGIQGFYDPLHPNAKARWDSELPDELLQPPGITTTSLVPEAEEDASVQWLAKQIVDDPRFGLAVTHTVYHGLTGRKPLRAPSLGSEDYEKVLRAFQAERALLESVANSFMASGRDIRVLVTELIKSPLLRTVSIASDGSPVNEIADARFGLDKMPQADDLERKLKLATGYSWYNYYAKTDAGEANYHWNNHMDRPGRSLLVEFREQCGNGGHGCYARWHSLLGGLDINPAGGNARRPTVPNVVIAAIYSRMAVEMPWRLVARDFSIKSKDNGLFARTLFPHVQLDTVPEDDDGEPLEDNIALIVANIQHLFLQLHGHERDAEDEEVQAAYQLFYDVWKLGLKKGKQLDSSERVDQDELDELAAWEAQNGIASPVREPVNKDTFNTVRAWRVVLDYFLSDAAFLYDQNSGEVSP
jgi:hypothetical protein